MRYIMQLRINFGIFGRNAKKNRFYEEFLIHFLCTVSVENGEFLCVRLKFDALARTINFGGWFQIIFPRIFNILYSIRVHFFLHFVQYREFFPKTTRMVMQYTYKTIFIDSTPHNITLLQNPMKNQTQIRNTNPNREELFMI